MFFLFSYCVLKNGSHSFQYFGSTSKQWEDLSLTDPHAIVTLRVLKLSEET